MDKYEYLTGEDLGYNSGVVEKVKFEYYPLGEALNNNKAKSKTNKVVKRDKGDKNLFCNQQHSFAKFKGTSDIQEMSFDSLHKKLN